jgi:hypothetical protein
MEIWHNRRKLDAVMVDRLEYFPLDGNWFAARQATRQVSI